MSDENQRELGRHLKVATDDPQFKPIVGRRSGLVSGLKFDSGENSCLSQSYWS